MLTTQANNLDYNRIERMVLLRNFKEVKLKCQFFLAPKEHPPIIEWLEENLILPDSFPIPGPFRIKNSPHLHEPLLRAIDPEVRSITLMGCSQAAKTLFFICVWAYDVVNDPCPYLYAHPTDGGVKSFAMQKLEPVINATPILKKMIAAKRRGNTDESSTRFKIYPGGWVEIISLQSPGKTRQRSVRKIINDDTDEIKVTLRSEGSAHSNLETRTTVYKYNYKHFYGSTPRQESSSFIEMKFREGSQAHYMVTCPHCQTQQVLDEDLIVWDRDRMDLLGTEFHNRFDTARIKCKKCEFEFSESERIDLLQRAKWVHKYPTRIQHLSYQLGKASSTLGSLEKIAEAKVGADKASEQGDDSLYESFVNNEKGLPYRKIVATEIDEKLLLDKREDYIDPENMIIPNGVLILTAWSDAQEGSLAKPARFETEVWGWGYGEECWIVDRFTTFGDPRDLKIRKELKDKLLNLVYQRKDGLKLQLKAVGFDSGWSSQSIYEITERMSVRKWYCTKGANSYLAPLLPNKLQYVNNGKTALLNIGTQKAKAELFGRLDSLVVQRDVAKNDIERSYYYKVTKGESVPKYIHHTKAFCDPEYYSQLSAERGRKILRGLVEYVIYEKKKPNLANEAIDIWCGNYALIKVLNVNWKKYKQNFDKKVGALNDVQMTGDELQQGKVGSSLEVVSKPVSPNASRGGSPVVSKPLAARSVRKGKIRNGVNQITNY